MNEEELLKLVYYTTEFNHELMELNLKYSEEIERLNNIINVIENESHLGRIENQNNNDYSKGLYTAYRYINDKIKELKGVDKE